MTERKTGLVYPGGEELSRQEIVAKNTVEAEPQYDISLPPTPGAKWFAEVAKRRQEEMEAIEPHFFYTRILYETDKPILLCCQGDTHIGAREMAVDKFEKDRKAILETPNAKVALFGDLIDNTFFAGGEQEQTNEAEFQYQWALQVVKEYFDNDKLAFTLPGEHLEYWNFRKTGLSAYRNMQRMIGEFPFLFGPAKVEMVVGDQLYKMGVSHRAPGSSIYTSSHPSRRLERDRFHGADLLLSAHTHERAVDRAETEDFNGIRDVIYSVVGCYKKGDRFQRKHGNQTGQMGGVSFILMPDEHKILGFKDIVEGTEIFKYMQG